MSAPDLGPCPYCDGTHEGLCPHIIEARGAQAHDARDRAEAAGLIRHAAPAPEAEDLSWLNRALVEKLKNELHCPLCGGVHGGLCRRVAEVEYWPDVLAQGMAGIKWARLRETWDESGTVYDDQLAAWERALREMGKW